jgi:hypothetical protein
MQTPRRKREPKERKIAVQIRDYKSRKVWQEGVSPAGTVWAFYNNGLNLYVEPFNQPAVSYYRYTWRHLPYVQYCHAQRLTSLPGRSVIFQTFGHIANRDVLVAFGCNDSQILVIPPMHILYVNIEGEIVVKSHLLQFQPLPVALIPLRFQY